MKMGKVIALFLAFVIVSVGTLVGCKGEDSKTASVQEEVLEIASPSWKTDTSPTEISWFMSFDWYGKKFSPKTNEFDKKLLEETGVTIDVQTGNMDKFNVLIQTGKLPDIITTAVSEVQRSLLEDNYLVLDLEELSNKYAPDLYAAPTQKEWLAAADGNWYGIANFYYDEGNMSENGGYFGTHNSNFVRSDILEDVGLSMESLRTKEGFLEALRAVKAQNIMYNDRPVVPYAAHLAGSVDESIAEQFGASRETKEGKYQSIYRTPEYKEAMIFFNQLYREGLMTDEALTFSTPQLKEKIASGNIFASTIAPNVLDPRKSLYAMDNDATILYAGAMQGDLHDETAVMAINTGGWTVTMINKNAENPARAIQLLSYLSQKETVLDNMYGVDCYELVDGMVVRNADAIELEARSPEEFNAKYKGGFNWVLDNTFVQGSMPIDTSVFGIDEKAQREDDSVILFEDKAFIKTEPKAGTEEALILVRIDEHQQQAIGRIVTADSEEECIQEYEDMLATFEELGLAKLEAYQDVEFQKNKKQLGVEFSHPFNQ